MSNLTTLLTNTVGADPRQHPAYAQAIAPLGWQTFPLGTGQIFLRRLGPVAISKFQRFAPPVPWAELDRFNRDHHVFVCKLEPGNWISATASEADRKAFLDQVNAQMRSHHFKPDHNVFLGMSTMYIDLTPSLSDIFSSFSPDAQRKIRHLEQTSHSVVLDDVENFYNLFSTAFKAKHLWHPPLAHLLRLKSSFGTDCFSLTLDNNCGCFVLINKTLALYLYAATSPAGKATNSPYLLIWLALQEAKKRGAKVWDFEGMYDPRHGNSGWKNFSQFKSRFHGEVVLFPGDYVQYRLPW